MPEFDVKLPDVLGWILKWLIISLALTVALNLLLYFAIPVIGGLGRSFDSVKNDPIGLGGLCLILIAIVGIIKLVLKK